MFFFKVSQLVLFNVRTTTSKTRAPENDLLRLYTLLLKTKKNPLCTLLLKKKKSSLHQQGQLWEKKRIKSKNSKFFFSSNFHSWCFSTLEKQRRRPESSEIFSWPCLYFCWAKTKTSWKPFLDEIQFGWNFFFLKNCFSSKFHSWYFLMLERQRRRLELQKMICWGCGRFCWKKQKKSSLHAFAEKKKILFASARTVVRKKKD